MTVTAPTLTRREAMKTAQRMREGGWSIPQIRDYLAARGWQRDRQTIRCWSDPELYARKLEQTRQLKRKQRVSRRVAERGTVSLARKNGTYSAEFKFARLMAMRDAGLSLRATAIMLGVDFGDEITESMVRYAENAGHYPKKLAA